MDVRPGYKRTPVGVIPEHWEVKPLQTVANIERGKFTARPRNDPKYYGGEIPFIQTGDVSNSSRWITTYSQTLNPEGLKVSKLFPQGTLFFTIAANIGDVAITRFATACPDSLVSIAPARGIDKQWLAYELAKRKPLFEILASHNAQLNINLEKLRPYLLPVPTLAEQEAIAEALSDTDALIESLEQLLTKKRQIKKGAMQELLTGKKRLPGLSGKWKLNRLAEVADVHRKNVVPALSRDTLFMHFSLPAFDAGRRPVTEFGEEIGSNKFHVPESAVLVSKLNPRISRVWAPIYVGSNAVASTEFLVLTPRDSISRKFLYFLCVSHRFCEQMRLLTSGTTGSHQRISPPEVMNIEVWHPESLIEQRAIATILSDMDEEIATLEAKRSKARQLKQGMMQELLTGKVRLV